MEEEAEAMKDKPAFPWQQSPGNQDNLGMTLHQWFAGMALQGKLAEGSPFVMGDLADECLNMADAMIAAYEERAKNP